MEQTNETVCCEECQKQLEEAGFEVILVGNGESGECGVCNEKRIVYRALWKKKKTILSKSQTIRMS